jgi:hypothetical protein
VVASLIRLKFVVGFGYSIDINCMPSVLLSCLCLMIFLGDDFGIVVLSIIELSLSIICVCFPAVKLLLNAKFPKYFGSSSRSSIDVQGSIHLSDEGTESSPQSWKGLLRSKISTLFGSPQPSKLSSSRIQQWSDEESGGMQVVNLPHIKRTDSTSMVESAEELHEHTLEKGTFV